MSGWLAIPINLDKWSSTLMVMNISILVPLYVLVVVRSVSNCNSAILNTGF